MADVDWQAMEDEAADAAAKAVRGVIQAHRPEPEVVPTMHYVLVSFQSPPDAANLGSLNSAVQDVAAWFRQFGLRHRRRAIHTATLPDAPATYSFWSVIEGLREQGLAVMTGKDAWYLFLEDPLPWPIGGTVGGDVLGQTNGQEGNRVPGISFAGSDCVWALTHDGPPPGSSRTISRAIVEGWMGHEEGHLLSLSPCRVPHGPRCWMTGACYNFPNCVIGCDDPKIWAPDPPHYRPGDEREAFLRYGFMVAT